MTVAVGFHCTNGIVLERFSQRCSEAVSGVPDEVLAFRRGKEPERGAEERAHVLETARARGAQERFQFGEGLFDRIEVGTIRGQEAERGPGGVDRGADRWLLVDRQVIEHHHIAALQGGDQDLLDIREERGRIDRAVKHGRRREPVEPERRHHGVGLPVAARRVIVEARAAGTAAIPPQQIGGDAALIQKDVLPDIAQRLPVAPLATGRGDIRAPLFVGVQSFF